MYLQMRYTVTIKIHWMIHFTWETISFVVKCWKYLCISIQMILLGIPLQVYWQDMKTTFTSPKKWNFPWLFYIRSWYRAMLVIHKRDNDLLNVSIYSKHLQSCDNPLSVCIMLLMSIKVNMKFVILIQPPF